MFEQQLVIQSIIKEELQGYGIETTESASPFFHGLICHKEARVPYLVGDNLNASLKEHEGYYAYHFKGYNFFFFERKGPETKVYFHPQSDEIVFYEVTWSALLVYLNSL